MQRCFKSSKNRAENGSYRLASKYTIKMVRKSIKKENILDLPSIIKQ